MNVTFFDVHIDVVLFETEVVGVIEQLEYFMFASFLSNQIRFLYVVDNAKQTAFQRIFGISVVLFNTFGFVHCFSVIYETVQHKPS